MNDKQLTELLRRDHERGLAEVVRMYSAYVMKIVRTKLSDVCTHEDIEEAVSDIFLKFYAAGVGSGFEMRSVKAYLSVIAERHCVNLFYKYSRTRQIVRKGVSR